MNKSRQDIPYPELFQAFTDAARQQLQEHTGGTCHLLAKSAYEGLEESLLQRLTYATLPLSDLKFSAFCAVRGPAFFGQACESASDEALYPMFISQMIREGWPPLFREFPHLEYLLTSLCDFWVESCRELMERLHSDWQILQETFDADRKITQVTEIRGGLSDPHHRGRSVMLVVFDSGLKVLYKPRNLDIDSAWFDLLSWFNQHTDFPQFKTLCIVSRENYGWMEYAEYQPFEIGDASREYYHRAGMLLCLIHLFGGSDFQHENVIVCGKAPVLTDIETLLQPGDRYESDILSPIRTRLSGTTLGTHFLPQWETDPKGNPADAGGMGRLPLPSEDEVEIFVRGFGEMYRYLAEHRAVLDATSGPLEAFAHQRIRVIFRDTSLYGRILKKSLHPRFLRARADRRAFLESCLTRVPVSPEVFGQLLPRCDEEIRMMEDMDIPYFQTDTASKDLHLFPSQSLENYFSETAYERMRHRLIAMDERSLVREIAFIRASFYFRRVFANEIPMRKATVLKKENPDSLLAEKFTKAALEIARHIREMAIFSGSGAVSWAIPEDIIAFDGRPLWRFQAPDCFLYQGITGIALFLSATEQICPGAGWGELAMSALKPICERADHKFIPQNAGLGAGSGIGALIYGLTRISGFLERPSLLKVARKFCDLMTDELIEADEKFDVLDGSAGAILGLLALYEAAPDPVVMERAVQCGRHLLASRSADESGLRSWKTIRGKRVSGMAHGTAGIAYALLRLHAVTRTQDIFGQAAKEAIAFENTFFSSENGNWRAFGSDEESPVFWNSFCHGATGIGLARLGGLKGLDTSEIREHVEIAVRTSCDELWDGPDFLCCGKFGRIEFLLEAARRLDRKELLRVARERAARILADKEREGHFNLFEDFPAPVDNPGFFRGSAGIGYTLLRLVDPHAFPCVLLWL